MYLLFKVVPTSVEVLLNGKWYRSRNGTDFDTSEIASPVLHGFLLNSLYCLSFEMPRQLRTQVEKSL